MTINLPQRYIDCSIYALVFLILTAPATGNAMASINPLKACTFSEMNILLTLNGEPAAGAKVIRSVNWKKEKTDTFTADDAGRVHLPAMYESSFTQVLPVEFVSSQLIKVIHNDKEYKIWVYAKRDPKENFEMNGNPLNLSCELTDEPKTQRAFDSVVKTSCKWTD